MPRGGARKGAGRKPKPLAEKLAEGNPGHRPLKKVEFVGRGGIDPRQPPDYLKHMVKFDQANRPVPTPTELYTETVRYLEPSDCLSLIPTALIADYAMAKYHLINSQYELGRTATVAHVDTGKRDKKGDPIKNYQLTDFTEAMLKLQKNVLATWEPIWEIVSRNSERLVANPEQDLMAMMIIARQRKTRPKGALPDGLYGAP